MTDFSKRMVLSPEQIAEARAIYKSSRRSGASFWISVAALIALLSLLLFKSPAHAQAVSCETQLSYCNQKVVDHEILIGVLTESYDREHALVWRFYVESLQQTARAELAEMRVKKLNRKVRVLKRLLNK